MAKTTVRKPRSRANGDGSVYERNRTLVAKDGTKSERTYWCAELAWIDHDGTPTKKIIQRTSKGAAQTALARLKDEIRSGTLVSGADATISVEDVMENYLDDVALGVRANTIETYRTIVAHHVVPHLGRRRANSLRRTGVVGWLNDLEANEVGDRLREVAYRLLKAAVGPYVANLPPREHPFPRGKGPKSDAPAINVWSAEEVGKFLAAAADDRYHAVYVLALSAGLRQGEILALRWRDIRKASVAVRGTLVRKTRTVADPKTETSRRNVAVPQNVILALDAHRKRQETKGHASGPDDFVFTAKSGRPVGVKNLYHHSFVPLIESAEVPRISFHALRHTNASLLLDAGVNVKVIQERFGHRDAALILKRYAHLMPAAHAAAADKIADFFIPASSTAKRNVRGNVRESGVPNDPKPTLGAKKTAPSKSRRASSKRGNMTKKANENPPEKKKAPR